MDASHHERIQRLFRDAASLPAEERERYLKDQCNDESVRREVQELLKYDEVKGGGLTGDFDDRYLPTENVPLSDSPAGSSNLIDHGRFLPGTVLSDRYRIVGLLGKGGMGEVYRADDLELGQSVALKFLPKKLADVPRALERFRGEVRFARQVSHPNVCRVYDIGQIDGQWFLSMQYIDGEDLAQLLTRIGRFNADRATELARQLCLGLHAAHENGVLHRDLKPANIMIDGRGKLLITDFGLAEIADEIRADDIRSGTPAYMSPEQLAGREVTERSDIYSLGIVLHEIYTGKPVWEARSMAELLEKRSSTPIPNPSSYVSDLDPLVEQVVQRCLQPDPERRPRSPISVMATLPGGDPLQAALAAGTTPSPEMVAAAGDDATAPRWIVTAALICVVLSLSLLAWLTTRPALDRISVVHEPSVLRDEVQEMLTEELGLVASAGEMIHGFAPFRQWTSDALCYWFRQRRDGASFGVDSYRDAWGRRTWGRPSFYLPPQALHDETTVVLSGEKQLIYFSAATIEATAVQKPVPEPAWSKWFTPKRTNFYLPTAGEDTANLKLDPDGAQILKIVHDQVPPPPVPFDVEQVWEGTHVDGSSFLVHAAARNGKPVFFAKVASDHYRRGHINQGTSFYSVYLSLILVGAVVGWRNLWAGRGDKVGGRRLAIYVFVINLIATATYCRMPMTIEETLRLLEFTVAGSLLSTCLIWVWYMALEPHLRRTARRSSFHGVGCLTEELRTPW